MKNIVLFLLFLSALALNSCKKGDLGPEGPEGAEGPAGPQGANAPNQIIKLLSYSSETILPNLAAASGVVVPANCRTEEYTANEGEIAIIHMDSNLLPSPLSSAVVFLSVGISTNSGMSFTSNNLTQSMDNLGDGMASSSISALVPLTAGTKYIFGSALQLSGNMGTTATFARSSSHCTVMIVKMQ